jgi:DNA-directed RNA polymerase
MENLKTKIKESFYEDRLKREFESLWRAQVTNGSAMRRDSIMKHCILSSEYKNILIELLEETGYFVEVDKQDAETIEGIGSTGEATPSTK